MNAALELIGPADTCATFTATKQVIIEQQWDFEDLEKIFKSFKRANFDGFLPPDISTLSPTRYAPILLVSMFDWNTKR